ncbi:MAG: hypothetical protein AAGJ46_18705 [Planctomycetota bacterium]
MNTPTDEATTPDEATRPATWMLFCETRRKWSAAVRFRLRRASRDRMAERVVATAALPSAPVLTDANAPAVLGLEVDRNNAVEVLEQIAGLRSSSDYCMVALVADRSLTSRVEPMLLEAGARLVVFSPRQTGLVVALHDRHAARRLAAGAATTLKDEAWRRLPWQPDPWAIR